MDLKLFIHGVVNGDDFWCDSPAEGEIEQNYMSSFYRDDITGVAGPRLMAYGRNNGAGDYWYYTYVVGGNVNGLNRPGSYFAMTLRLDACCTAIGKIFRILDMVFNVEVVGPILHKTGNSYKYAISSFRSAETSLRMCYNTILKTIGDCFTSGDFDVSARKIANSGLAEIEENLYECNETALVQKLRAGHKIIVSPTAMTSAQRSMQAECQKRIEDVRRECNVRLKDAAQKESSFMTVKAEKERLEHENRQLQSQLQSVSNTKKVDVLISSIRQPVKELATCLATSDRNHKDVASHDNNPGKHDNNSGNGLWMQIATIALLVFIAMWLVFSGGGHKKQQAIDEADTARAGFVETAAEDEEPETGFSYTGFSYEDAAGAARPEIDPATLGCNIAGYNGSGSLQPARTYTLQLRQNGTQPSSPLPVEWAITGAQMSVSPENPNECDIVPVAGMGVVTIAVRINGEEYRLSKDIPIQ